MATSLAIGFILAPAAAHLFKAHMGFSLYNMGFTAGIVGTLIVALYKSYGFVPDPVFIWTTGHNLLLSSFLTIVFASMLGVGYFLDRSALKGVRAIMRAPGQRAERLHRDGGVRPDARQHGADRVHRDDLRARDPGLSQRAGDRGDPDHRRLLGLRQAPPQYRSDHARRLHRLAGQALGRADPSATLAALFGTTLAPIAGRFGWQWGLVAGFVHSSAALSVGALHAGLNLYNNGFAAGIVASALVPVILAVRAGFGYDDNDLKA